MDAKKEHYDVQIQRADGKQEGISDAEMKGYMQQGAI